MASSRTDQQIAEELWEYVGTFWWERHCSPEKVDEIFVVEVSRILAEVRAAERDDRWIPVEERLPEDGSVKIVWTVYTEGEEWPCIGLGYYVNRWYVPTGRSVTHWQPLPEPPRSRQEANHG